MSSSPVTSAGVLQRWVRRSISRAQPLRVIMERMNTPRLVAYACTFLTAAALGLACGGVGNGSPLVGGSCDKDRDCEYECSKGGDFPDGTCTIGCDEDRECPGGTYCVDKDGGVCLLACGVDEDCRQDYSCKDTKRQGEKGDAAVCIH
jgi:hypothetical protein